MARIDDVYEEADGMMTDWDWLITQPQHVQKDVLKGLRREKKVKKSEYIKRHAKKE